MDYSSQIQRLRNLVTQIEHDLACFGRRAQEPVTPVTKVGQMKLGKMIRFAEEQRFNTVLASLVDLRDGLNQLDAMVEDEVEDRIAEKEEEEDDDDAEA